MSRRQTPRALLRNMIDAAIHLLVLIAGAAGLIRGYRSGFTGQVASVLGIAFGAVAAQAFGDMAEEWLRGVWPSLADYPASGFLYSLTAYTLVFGSVCALFWLIGRLLAGIMKFFKTDLLNSVGGALFCALKYLFFLSLVYNLIGGVFPHSRIMKYGKADDGNLVEFVMLIAPRVIGCMDCEDLSHIIQLRDAKKIS